MVAALLEQYCAVFKDSNPAPTQVQIQLGTNNYDGEIVTKKQLYPACMYSIHYYGACSAASDVLMRRVRCIGSKLKPPGLNEGEKIPTGQKHPKS